jgi:SAM-dependent methyltransferase
MSTTYDDELRAHNARLRAAARVAPGDDVLDVGCGAGQTTHQAARAAAHGRVLGIDVSGPALERARELAAAEGLRIGEFAKHSPGFDHDLLVVDSTPVECARSVETVRRSQLADAADHGYCRSHSRFFWGVRLHRLFASLALAAGVALNHHLGRPSRALVNYSA